MNANGQSAYVVASEYKEGSGTFRMVYRPEGTEVESKHGAYEQAMPMYVVGFDIDAEYDSGYAMYSFPATETGFEDASAKLLDLAS
jgi:hypothetical protein